MVQHYLKCSLAPSTIRTYNSGKNRYVKFCVERETAPLPLTEKNLCEYVAYLAQGDVKRQSIKCYLSAARHLQVMSGQGDPFREKMPLLEYVLRGIKSEQAKKSPTSQRVRLPITPEVLLRMRHVWERNSREPDNIMLWAACTTCFFGFLRSGEITVPSQHEFDPGAHLCAGDVTLDSRSAPQIAQLNIKASKTDPFRHGVSIFLGKTGNRLCPVTALAAYLAIRGNQPGPFFQFRDGRPLSRERFVVKVREALTEAGLEASKFAGHSFRIGAATTAAARGVEDSLIKTLGRWESSAYLLYVRIPRERLAGLSTVLSKQD